MPENSNGMSARANIQARRRRCQPLGQLPPKTDSLLPCKREAGRQIAAVAGGPERPWLGDDRGLAVAAARPLQSIVRPSGTDEETPSSRNKATNPLFVSLRI